MYSMSTRCVDHRQCALRARLGPPDNDCHAEHGSPTKTEGDVGDTRITECHQNANYGECELGDDAVYFDREKDRHVCCHESERNYLTVNGKEELPSVHGVKYCLSETVGNKHVRHNSMRGTSKVVLSKDKVKFCKNGNIKNVYAYCTLPKSTKKAMGESQQYSAKVSPPKRVTPDGTHIYYWCDLHKRDNELDDGAYNPLWTMQGFTQTFHFWKESKRAQSVPLNAFLTYVTLPWWSIAKDILDHREGPILTF